MTNDWKICLEIFAASYQLPQSVSVRLMEVGGGHPLL